MRVGAAAAYAPAAAPVGLTARLRAFHQRQTAVVDPTNSPMRQGLLGRHSLGIKHLAEPGPDEAQLLAMTQAALRAPDHAGLVPFRFKSSCAVPCWRRGATSWRPSR